MFSENLVPRRTASVIAAIDRIREKKAVPFGVGVWVVDGYGYPLVGRCSHGRCLKRFVGYFRTRYCSGPVFKERHGSIKQALEVVRLDSEDG